MCVCVPRAIEGGLGRGLRHGPGREHSRAPTFNLGRRTSEHVTDVEEADERRGHQEDRYEGENHSVHRTLVGRVAEPLVEGVRDSVDGADEGDHVHVDEGDDLKLVVVERRDRGTKLDQPVGQIRHLRPHHILALPRVGHDPQRPDDALLVRPAACVVHVKRAQQVELVL